MVAIERLKAVIQRGQKVYYSSKQYLKSFYDSERLWADKHLHQGEEWIRGYWDSRDHPHRKLLLKKIEAYAPISSILEVGCCCGVNLALFSQRFPDAVMRGIDINSKAVENGNRWLAEEGITNVRLGVGRADQLKHISDQQFEVLLVDGMLVHIPPRQIRKVMRELLRITRRVLIFCEPYDFSGKDKDGSGLYRGGLHYKWRRNYLPLLKQFVPEERIQVTKIPKEAWPEDQGWQENGAIVEVDLSGQAG